LVYEHGMRTGQLRTNGLGVIAYADKWFGLLETPFEEDRRCGPQVHPG
jgi:hypothetical protein